jgi:O-antigen/teichoic acid export membrane protein
MSTGTDTNNGAAIFRRLAKSGVPHLIAATLALQGSSYVVQLIVAHLVPAAQFGYVRILEAGLAILFIPASLGMSSSIATFVPKAQGADMGRRIFVTSLILSVVMAVVVGAVVTATDVALSHNSLIGNYLSVLVWVLPVMTISRNVLGYYQGRGQIQKMARFNLYSAALALTLVTLLTYVLSLRGWLVGRLLSEALFAILLLATVRVDLKSHFDSTVARLVLSFGLIASLGFALDRLINTADTLYLAYFLHDPTAVANYGIASIAYLSILLVPTSVCAALYPRMARFRDASPSALHYVWRITKANVLFMIPISGAAYFLVPTLALAIFGPNYHAVGPIFHIMVFAALASTILNVVGTFFFAIGRADCSLYGNLVGAAALLTFDFFLIPTYGANGAATGVVLAALARLLAYGVLMSRLRQEVTG